jgi:YYY domain-containing protein
MSDAEEAEQERKTAARAFARLKFRKNATDEEKKQALDEGPMIEDSSDDGRVLFGLYLPDLVVILIGLCALGLILMPEVIYVKDIYGGEHYRANTMFKLTYQAFILFGMMMGYVIERCYLRGRRAGRIFSIVALVLVVFTAGYIFKSIDSWFGNVFKSNNRISTDASVFVDESMSTDFDAISWLNNKVTGRPVVLEAPGDSYTDYQRVSVATGLPTVLGWYVHEWLWRNDTDSLNVRAADCQTIYTSQDEETVRQLIDKYNISYIYIGQLERQKYPDLNDSLLQSLGQVAYSDGETTYIMRTAPRTS